MPETFVKRAGTTDEGKDYEHLYIANLILRLIQDEKIKNFFISSNDKNFGSFDDVVVEIEYKDRREVYALQLKHKGSSKRTLAVSALVASTGDYSLEKYFVDYTKTKNLQNSVTVILFTNSDAQIPDKIQMKFEKQEFELQVSRKSGDVQFLTSSKGGCCYTFASTNQYKRFFDNFILYTGQAGVEQIRNEIKKGLKELFACDEVVFKEYLNFITGWSMKKGKKFKLEKVMMKRVITMCVLSPNIEPLVFSSSPVCKRAELFRKAISKFDATVLKENSYEKVKKLWEDVIHDLDFKNVNKVIFKYQLVLEEMKKIEDFYLDNKETSKLLWLLGKCPLVVKKCQQSYQAVDFCKNETFILLSADDKSIPKSLQSLSDLKVEQDIYEEILDNFTYSLEGQKEAPLRILLEVCTVEDQITFDDLAQMVDSPLVVGKEKEIMPPCHTPRTLSKTVIRSQFLERCMKDTLVAITCIKDVNNFKQRFAKIQMTFVDNMDQVKIDSVGIYVTTKESFQPQIESALVPNIKYHHFKFLNNDLLEWITSSNGIDDLEEFYLYRTDHTIEESQLCDNHGGHNVNIFCANPGMGKSTLMKSLKKNSSSKIWTILLTARNHALHFSKHKNSVERFFEHILNGYDEEYDKIFQKNIFESFIAKRRFHIIWDGLDEVSDKNLPFILDVVEQISRRNIKQWLTSRNNLKDLLEKKFSAFSREIHEFDKEEQKKYIRNRLNLSNEDLSEIFEKIRTNIQLFANNDILGIPLQIYMLTELFREDKSKLNLLNNSFTVANLYEHFITEKFNIYYKDKMNQDLNIERNYQKYREDQQHQFNCYKNVAFNLHFPQNFLEKIVYKSDNPTRVFLEKLKTDTDSVGLITRVTKNNIVEFSHNSFGEYFAALYLFEHYESKVRNKKIIFDEKYKNIRFFLDLILSKNCKGHIAVMYRNWKLFVECSDNDLTVYDKANRDILELACNWSREGSCTKFVAPSGDFDIFWSNFELYNRKVLKTTSYGNILQHFRKFNNSSLNFDLNLKKLMYFFPNLISLYARALLDDSLKRSFVLVVLYYGIKMDCSIVFNCIEKIPWMQNEFECLELESLLTKAIDYESVDVFHILVSKYRCGNIIIENPMLAMGLCWEKFSNFFDIVDKYCVTDQFINYACRNGTSKQVQFLIDRGARVDHADQNGRLPIHKAFENEAHITPGILQVLINNGANVDATNRDGIVPIHYPCMNMGFHSTETIQLLIDNGAKIDVADPDGRVPIHHACGMMGDYSAEIVQLLIDNGAKVDVADHDGLMPMHYACRNNGYYSAKIVQLLIDNGAKVDVVDHNGLMPIFYVCKNSFSNSANILQILIDNSAKVDVADQNGLMPIHYACKNFCSDSVKIVKLLIGIGVKVDVMDQNGLMPIHYACTNMGLQSAEILQLLIDNGADINVAAHNGLKPIHYARKNTGFSASRAVQVLIDNGANDLMI